MPRLQIHSFVLGMWETNCYVIHAKSETPSSQPTPCWIIDTGFEPFAMIQAIKRANLSPQAVLLTHAHIDHIAGLPDLRRNWPMIPILIHPEETSFLGDPMLNLSAFLPEPLMLPQATGTFADGDTLDIAGISCKVLHTPGHSPGGVTFYFADENTAFVGDTLFYDSIGRYDFPTSDGPTLLRSIRERLFTLPDNTRVLPGHMQETTILREKNYNPYLT